MNSKKAVEDWYGLSKNIKLLQENIDTEANHDDNIKDIQQKVISLLGLKFKRQEDIMRAQKRKRETIYFKCRRNCFGTILNIP